MGGKGFTDELMRAVDRPDIGSLREKVALYRAFNAAGGKERETMLEHRFRDFDPYFLPNDDPDLGLAIVVLAAATYDDEAFLGVMAAGPLEELLSSPAPGILDRVLAEARKNARFRWLLRGIFPHAIADHARPQIAAAIAGLSESDPLPPR